MVDFSALKVLYARGPNQQRCQRWDYYGLFAPIGSKCSIERENKTAPEKVYYCTKVIDIFAQSEVFYPKIW